MPIEINFNKEILLGEGTYEEAYHKYLTEWQLTIWKAEHMDIRMVEINRTYFADNFSPKEKE